MGVSACGKSTIGAELARRLACKFIDGDDLHPQSNIQKMAHGHPLNDNDRKPWLERIRNAAFSLENKNEHGIIVCSALKKCYRDQIREGNKNVTFLFLDGTRTLILDRIRKRHDHFMKESMLISQFDILERPDAEPKTIVINIENSIEEIVNQCVHELNIQPRLIP